MAPDQLSLFCSCWDINAGHCLEFTLDRLLFHFHLIPSGCSKVNSIFIRDDTEVQLFLVVHPLRTSEHDTIYLSVKCYLIEPTAPKGMCVLNNLCREITPN